MRNEFILAVLKAARYDMEHRSTKAAVMESIKRGVRKCVSEPDRLAISAMQHRIAEAMESSRLKAPMLAQIETEIWAIEQAIFDHEEAVIAAQATEASPVCDSNDTQINEVSTTNEEGNTMSNSIREAMTTAQRNVFAEAVSAEAFNVIQSGNLEAMASFACTMATQTLQDAFLLLIEHTEGSGLAADVRAMVQPMFIDPNAQGFIHGWDTEFISSCDVEAMVDFICSLDNTDSASFTIAAAAQRDSHFMHEVRSALENIARN